MEPGFARPFDAAELLMRERPGSPRREWATVSLIMSLRDGLVMPPGDGLDAERLERLSETVEVLTARGIDGDSLVRYGMGTDLVSAIVSTVVLPFVLNRLPGESPSIESSPAGWEQLLISPGAQKDFEPSDKTDVTKWLLHFLSTEPIELLRYWVESFPLPELLGWVCPDPQALQDARSFNPLEYEIGAKYRWVVERFTKTFLIHWSTGSLHLEYRWLKGEVGAPCPDREMGARSTALIDVNAEIAARAVRDNPDREKPPIRVDQIKRQALDFLREGRRTAAATLFEAFIGVSPLDPEAHNNFGFCLIPDDPERALKAFEEATRLKFPWKAMITHNQMMAYTALGQPRLAVSIASNAWDFINEANTSNPAILWEIHGELWRLADTADAAYEVARLASSITQDMAGSEHDLWERRRSERATRLSL